MKFESMAIGAAGAFFFHKNRGFLSGVTNVQWRAIGAAAIVSGIVSFWACPLALQDGLFLFQSFLFLVLILAGVFLPNSMPDLVCSSLVWLGQRSYGIYMWHMMVLTFTANCISQVIVPDSSIFIPLLFISTVLTIGISHLSFLWVEKPFLRLKEQFGTRREV